MKVFVNIDYSSIKRNQFKEFVPADREVFVEYIGYLPLT